MIKKIDITDLEMAKDVLAIQIPSYKTEAELIGFYDIPPLKDTAETLRQCGETFFGYYLNEELAGAVSLKADGKIIDIHRMIVHPKHFRKGIAKELLAFIENSAEDHEEITVSTGTENIPATALYLNSGFLKTGERRVAEHLSLTFFKKKL